MVVVDAGVKISDLHEAGIARYVVRLSKNFTAQRSLVSPYSGLGRPPCYGETVRPLPRSHKVNLIPATPPDRVERWEVDERTLHAEVWENLLLPGVVPDSSAHRFHVYALYYPDFDQPWLLATPLPL